MRRFCWVLGILVLLTGCTPREDLPEKQLAGAKEIVARCDTVEFTMVMTETGCQVRFVSPPTLKPLFLTCEGQTLRAQYDEIETEVPMSFAQRILPLYRAVQVSRTEEAEDAGEGIRRITLDGNEFLMYYDPVGGLITRLEAKGAEGTWVYQVLSCIERP